jgi:hypothetical protein
MGLLHYTTARRITNKSQVTEWLFLPRGKQLEAVLFHTLDWHLSRESLKVQVGIGNLQIGDLRCFKKVLEKLMLAMRWIFSLFKVSGNDTPVSCALVPSSIDCCLASFTGVNVWSTA